MSRSAPLPSHAFGLSSVDSFLFVGNGLPDAAPPEHAGVNDESAGDASAHGLDIAGEAVPPDSGPPDGGPDRPDLLDLPDGRALSGLVHASGIEVLDGFASAKGGGGGGKPGGGGGGGGGETLLSNHTSGLDTPDGFNIEIKFGAGTWTQALQTSFVDASELISDIITGDIQDVFFRGKVIDDISIEAKLSTIDGTGGILGQAGPTAYRTSGFLPAAAVMEFDVADAANFDSMKLFNDIVFHEMIHCIGFGTMWDLMGLVTDFSTDGSDLRFTGAQATAEFPLTFDTSGDPGAENGVPVESDFGSGTRGGHWNDGLLESGQTDDGQFDFGNEIMTGFINTGGNRLSDVTIAALDDMGYETIYEPGKDVASTLDLSIFADSMAAV